MAEHRQTNDLSISLANLSPKDDDEWLDWETRKDHVPFWKHAIAGNTHSSSYSIQVPVLA